MRKKISNRGSHQEAASQDAVKQEIRDLATMLRGSALDVAWRQWRAVGASAALKSQSARQLQSLIDPEGLLLFSLLVIDDERRLADLIADWMVLNSDLLSVQRVKNLLADYPTEVQDKLVSRLGWAARFAVEKGKDFRWRSLIELPSSRQVQRISRTTSRSKVRAIRAQLPEPSALLLRLRLGLGVGVKADVIGFLLGTRDDWITIREIAEATSYSAVAVRRAVDDLEAARLIQARKAQPAGYRAERKHWANFLQVIGPPVWLYWHQQYVFVSAFVGWADSVENRPVSAYAFGAHGRELMERHQRAFAHHVIGLLIRYPVVSDSGAYVREAVHRLASSMAKRA